MNSFTFNEERKSFIKLLERGRPYWSPRLVERRGRIISNVKRDPSVLPLSLLVDGDTKQDLLQKAEEMALWLNTDDVAPLIFDDQPNRIYWSILEGAVEEDEIVSFSETSLDFLCVDKTGLEKSVLIYGNETVNVKGHLPTFWRTHTEFTSNVTGYELAFKGAGKNELKDINKIVLNGDFRSGDILEIDYRKRRVTLNNKDISNQIVINDTNYKELDIGSVEISSSVPTTVYYHERYY